MASQELELRGGYGSERAAASERKASRRLKITSAPRSVFVCVCLWYQAVCARDASLSVVCTRPPTPQGLSRSSQHQQQQQQQQTPSLANERVGHLRKLFRQALSLCQKDTMMTCCHRGSFNTKHNKHYQIGGAKLLAKGQEASYSDERRRYYNCCCLLLL